MITTHVLDLAHGHPARGLLVVLARRLPDGTWDVIGEGRTDEDGRQRALVPLGLDLAPGTYRLAFDTGAYFSRGGEPSFYPEVIVVFETGANQAHYHVPLLLNRFGYTTYRGT